jgi:hypothetical protein
MPHTLHCEFSLIRYVPDVVKGEFANIGVLLRDTQTNDITARFTRDWSRVRCLDPDADLVLLESLESEIMERLATGAAANTDAQQNIDAKPILETLEDSLSNSVQITAMQGTLAESLPAELDQLMRLYVEPIKLPSTRRKPSGRAAIAAQMRSEFERANVWQLMRKRIAASQYTQAGDPLKLDCGYKAFQQNDSENSSVKIFHAVSLASDVETAKSLAYSANALRAGVERTEAVPLELTAIVEPLASVSDAAEYAFGISVMEREAIRVLTVNDLGRVAATAQRELRA